jgi:glycerol kinase
VWFLGGGASGAPDAPVIVWQDRRTTPYVEELRSRGLAHRVHELTGLVLDPYFSAPLLHWLLHRSPRRRRGGLHFGNPVSWLLYRLTGVHAMDVSNAARTLLLDLGTLEWSGELLDLFEIPRDVLPPIVDCTGTLGVVTEVEELRGIPVVAMVGDMQAALLGAGGGREGVCKATYGTAGNVGLALGTTPLRGRTVPVTVEYATNEETRYCAEGNVFVVGGAIEWLCRVGVLPSVTQIDRVAEPLPDDAQVLIVPAFAGLATPYWEPRARGFVSGLDLGVSRGNLVYALLEGICLRVRQCVDALQEELNVNVDYLRADGGVAKSDVLMQLQADLIGVPVERLSQNEGAALGAAFLGFFSLGLFDSDRLASPPLALERFEPRRTVEWRQARLRRFEEAIRRTLDAADWTIPNEVTKA